MRIAQIAPLWESVPPPAYGGIELVVSHLTDELVRRGHEVTLFASGDSQTLATLESVHPQALRLDPSVKEPGIYEMLHLSRVYERAQQFDIIHSHMGCAALPYSGLVKTPTVHTLHGVFTSDNQKIFVHARHQSYVSISEAQRENRLGMNHVATVYNGINPANFAFSQPVDPPYLAFVGRLSPEKGPHHAIEIARRSGWKLKMAGKLDTVDREFYETVLRPHIDGQQIEYLGEVSHQEKSALLSGATATLFPITWREPFGLVMIESMAAGTPVVAMAMGAAPEVVVHGKTGFLCQTVDECVAALDKLGSIRRQDCRDHVVASFSVKQMVDGYEAVYRQVMAGNHTLNGHAETPVNVTTTRR